MIWIFLKKNIVEVHACFCLLG